MGDGTAAAEFDATSSQFRSVRVGSSDDQDQRFPLNIVKTSIYTPLSFLPKNLFKQFTRFSNVYFLFITALQLIPKVTSTPGFPTMVVPLVFIMVVSAVRDLMEDLDRHRSDDVQNRARVAKLDLRSGTRGPSSSLGNGTFTTAICADVRVGDLIRIAEKDEVPADAVLLATSNSRGQCFVMTANLDGESTLKPRYVPAELCGVPYGPDCFTPDGEITAAGVDRMRAIVVECEPPNRCIDRFEGSIMLTKEVPSKDALDLDISHILLKGTQLKDTRWAIGVVVYTGDDTKVRQNASDTPVKRSWLYRFINKITLWIVLAQIVILVTAVVMEQSMVSSTAVLQNPFIDDDIKHVDTLDLVYLFLAYMLHFSNFVPISLQVTIDFTRYFQARVIQNDPEMHCPRHGISRMPSVSAVAVRSASAKQTSVRVQSSELNEELGLVEHVFADKTGTLTCNRMEFRSCHVDGRTFNFDEGRGLLDPITDDFRLATITSFSPSSINGPLSVSQLESASTSSLRDPVPLTSIKNDNASRVQPLSSPMRKFLLNLAVNNSIAPASGGTSTSPLDFSSPSPDEKALVAAAARLKVALVRRDNGHVTVDMEGQTLEFQILHLFEFTSDRKKSSIVCRHPDGKIVLYCKGADTVIWRDLSANNHSGKVQQAKDHMQVYSVNGLRVLCIAERELSEDEYAAWNAQYLELRMSLKRKSKSSRSNGNAGDESARADAVSSMVSTLERDLMLVGISAIEDKIQDGAPQTLQKFREAGIKVWMLTGDRPDTATNVAFAVRLISSDMRLIKLSDSHWLESKSSAMHFFEKELESARKKDAQILTSSVLPWKPQLSFWCSSPTPTQTNNPPSGPRLAMIVDDVAVEAIRDFELEDEFLQLCMQCESVLCARISPKQKELIVAMVRARYPCKVTLAVGDGANDVPMIQRAHIGVGIAGLEGSQASDASDYSIPAFRFLEKLVLVHGRSMNRRIAVLTLYIFYKNVLLVLPQFVYGMYCLFSGQSSYYDPLLQLFNICFTSLPVLFFAIFDQDIAAPTILQYPCLYQDGAAHAFLNSQLFICWMLEATVASILIILIPAKLIPLIPWSEAGKDNDLWSMGLTQNFVVVVLANARLLLEVSDSQCTMLALATISILAWWGIVYVMSSSLSFGREFYGILRVGSLTQLALCCCFCVVLSLLFPLIPRVYEIMFAPTPRTICRELDYITDTKDRDNMTLRKHTALRGKGERTGVVAPT